MGLGMWIVDVDGFAGGDSGGRMEEGGVLGWGDGVLKRGRLFSWGLEGG